MRGDDLEENKVVPLIFKQFWSRSHLNKTNSLLINWFLSAKYLTFPLQHSRKRLFLCFSFANYLWLYWIGHQPTPFFENWSGRFCRQQASGKVQPWWMWVCNNVKLLKTGFLAWECQNHLQGGRTDFLASITVLNLAA